MTEYILGVLCVIAFLTPTASSVPLEVYYRKCKPFRDRHVGASKARHLLAMTVLIFGLSVTLRWQ